MKSSDRPKIIQFFVYNWQKKLLSLVLAIGLWVFVYLQNFEEQAVTIPIQFENLPEQYTILEMEEDVATISIRARENAFQDLDYYTYITPYINLSNASLGESYYPLELRVSNTEADFSVSPAKEELKVTIDELMSNQVEIRARIIGSPPPGYSVNSIELSRDTAYIKGASQVVAEIEFIETGTIDLEIMSNISVEKSLVVPEHCEVMGSQSVEVSIAISENRLSKEVQLAVTILDMPAGLEPAEDPEISATLNMPERFQYSYASRVTASADASSVTGEGRFLLPVSIETGSAISVSDTVEYISVQFVASGTAE